MLGTAAMTRKRPILIALFGLQLVCLVWVYLPMLDTAFITDDFVHLVFAKEHGPNFAAYLEPFHQHFKPLMRYSIAAQYFLFGLNPAPFYIVNFFIHVVNTVLVGYFVYRILGSIEAVLVATFLFSLGASHADSVQWITCRGQMISTFFFLLSLLSFLSYLESGSKAKLAASAVSHFLMMITFSMGPEVPFIYLALACVWPPGTALRARFSLALVSALPFVAGVAIYMACRKYFDAEPVRLPLGAVKSAAYAALFVIGGVYHGFVNAFTGSYYYLTAHQHFRYAYQLVIVLCLIALAEYAKFKEKRLLLMWLVGVVLAMYFLPAIARIEWGYGWFVHTGRYRYHLAIFAVTAFAAIFTGLRPFTSASGPLRHVLVAGLAIVILINMSVVRDVNVYRKKESRDYERLTQQFIQELKALTARPGEIIIVDRTFATEVGPLAGWLVNPSQVCTLYCTPEMQARAKFILERDAASHGPGLLEVEEDTGHLKPYEPGKHKFRYYVGPQT